VGARLVFPLRRLPNLSREDFQAYWLGTHAPLVAARAELLGIVRYQQVHTIADRRNVAVPSFDGIAELWVDPSAATGTPEQVGQAGAELLADERNFIDLRKSPIWMAEEHLLADGPGIGDVRLTALLRRAPGVSRAEFLSHWRGVHGPLALEYPEVLGFRRYLQLHTPEDAERFPLALERGSPPPFDGMSEVWLDKVNPDPEHAAAVRAIIMEDEAKFVDYEASPTFLGRVEVIVDRRNGRT
jgi:uncharacterized protein (TIGR02118 family)